MNPSLSGRTLLKLTYLGGGIVICEQIATFLVFASSCQVNMVTISEMQ